MSPLALTALIFGIMLLLMALRAPIAVAMFTAGTVGYVLQAGWLPLSNFLNTQAFARFASYDLSVIPLFILMGQFATQGGISKALFEFASAVMSRFRGGLAMASVMASAAFGAICGSSVATAATITSVALPEMKRHGYSGRLATGTLAAGGTLGILIPPSVPLVIYAILTEQNIAKLFAAAMVPGLLAMLGYVAVIALYTRLRPEFAAPSERQTVAERWHALAAIWPIVGIFVAVFGGIYGGVFSPTEGAAVGALLTFAVGLLRGELRGQGLRRALIGTAETSAMVFMIFLGADMMNASLALTEMPARIAEWVTQLQLPPLVIVAAVLLLYVVLGCVMDELSMLLLTVPVIFPAIMALDLWGLPRDMKAIWFGILVLMTVGIGLIAPPVGLNVYVVNNLARDVPMAETYKGVFPFLAWDVLRVLLLLVFPALALQVVVWLF